VPPTEWVLDTNVLISAALSAQGAPHQLVQEVLQRGCLVFSEASFAELRTRLYRPKFDRYLSLDMRQALLHDFGASARWVDPGTITAYCRDPDDDVFIATALAAGLQCMVSCDKDLLQSPLPPGFRVLMPAQALKRFTG
jgi:putative PIN family toxin of toxin-antitoxin system